MSSSALTIAAADRGFTWSDEETSILLQLWSNVHAQTNVSNGNKKGINIFEKVSEGMNSMGFLRTTSQCKEKIKRMKREYTVSKQRNQSGRNKKAMRFFELFEQILETIQLKNSESTIEKSTCPDKELEVKNRNIYLKKTTLKNDKPQPQPRSLRKRSLPVEVEDIPNPWSPDVVIIEEIPPVSSTSKSESFKFENGEPSKKKQTLDSSCSSLSFFKTMMNSLSLKFMKYQTESEEKMLRELEELENERAAMDERIQKMWVDFEERRKIDEREHELKITSSLQEIMNPKNLETEQK
ncbi:uncharacterized protein [Parasteatoda tepidariorum]|uniref:uncharacterized protein n=1 Tax=Parasteatoda tepidariorum TaxID=114398 RepID=UPI001C71ADBA|nr:trihelix transcription factor DF1 [Parasteatoda tepidariorum]